MRKLIQITNCETGSSELVLANAFNDALSFYRKKKNNAELQVSMRYHLCYELTEPMYCTKLSELNDGDLFRKVIKGTNEVALPIYRKVYRLANGMTECETLSGSKTIYLKGSTIVSIEGVEVL
jgi:hypothetical protein